VLVVHGRDRDEMLLAVRGSGDHTLKNGRSRVAHRGCTEKLIIVETCGTENGLWLKQEMDLLRLPGGNWHLGGGSFLRSCLKFYSTTFKSLGYSNG